MDCQHCYKRFTSKSRLQQHERAKTCQTACTLCGRELSSRQRLQSHLERKVCIPYKEKNTDNKCPVCQRAFSSKQRLQSHMKTKKCKAPVTKYQFGDLECYDCGGLMAKCPCPHIEEPEKELYFLSNTCYGCEKTFVKAELNIPHGQ